MVIVDDPLIRTDAKAYGSIVVMGSDPEAKQEAPEAGAYDFIYKGDPSEKLLNLLQTLVEHRDSEN